jgi:mRNA interferase MazF
LVISERTFNELTGYVFAAPATGTRRDWPFEAPIPPGDRADGVVLADQTNSIDYVAHHVRVLAKAPDGLVGSIIDLVTTTPSP